MKNEEVLPLLSFFLSMQFAFTLQPAEEYGWDRLGQFQSRASLKSEEETEVQSGYLMPLTSGEQILD